MSYFERMALSFSRMAMDSTPRTFKQFRRVVHYFCLINFISSRSKWIMSKLSSSLSPAMFVAATNSPTKQQIPWNVTGCVGELQVTSEYLLSRTHDKILFAPMLDISLCALCVEVSADVTYYVVSFDLNSLSFKDMPLRPTYWLWKMTLSPFAWS